MKQVILVTGGSSGIGRVIAQSFAQADYVVLINDIIKETGDQVLMEIDGKRGKHRFIHADVSDAAQVKSMFEVIREEYGRIDVLVNNAGTPGPFSMILDISDEDWHRTMAVHLHGTFYCMREAARMMIENGFGRIVNIVSIAGLLGPVGSAEYGAAKAGVINLTKTAAKELGHNNITVNAIAPGMVATPTNLKLMEKGSPFIREAVDGTPTGRMTNPEEIAAVTLFLCSTGAMNINGQVIVLDGGADIMIGMDHYMNEFLSRRKPQAEKG